MVSGFVSILLVVSMLDSFLKRNFIDLLLGLVTLILIYIPHIISAASDMLLPSAYKNAIVLFIFCAIYLGHLNFFYDKIWWWDLAVHLYSGVIFGFSGLLVIYILNKDKNINTYMTPAFIALFMFLFAVGSGTVWEIYEFMMDAIFNIGMQRGSLTDTMTDIIADTAGALLVSAAGYSYEKYKNAGIIKFAMIDFFKLNGESFHEEESAARRRA